MKPKASIAQESKIQHKMFRRIVKILGNILFVFLIIVAAVIIYFTIQSKMAGGTPMIAGYKLYVVLSGSMEPVLHTGSVVLVKQIPAADLAVNDIITFAGMEGSTQLVTHRITAISEGSIRSFTTKGDANNAIDSQPVLSSAVTGKVIRTVPYAGYAIDFARSRLGLLVLVILPGALIAVLEIFKLFKYAIQLDREKQEKIRTELEKTAVAERSEETGKGE